MKHELAFIPSTKEGKNVDLDFSVVANSVEEAIQIFQLAHNRLLYPDNWARLAGAASAVFNLSTPGNNDTQRAIQVSDYITISIPGPGNILGDGFDWIQVKKMEYNIVEAADESFGLTLAACANPNNIVQDTAHFFDDSSTSSFVLQRNGFAVTVNYYGRNEKPNQHTISVIDNVRNTLVAAGAAAGLSELQWLSLLKGLLQSN